MIANGAAHTNYSVSLPITYTQFCRVIVCGQTTNCNPNCCGTVHFVQNSLNHFEVTTQEYGAAYIGSIVYISIGI